MSISYKFYPERLPAFVVKSGAASVGVWKSRKLAFTCTDNLFVKYTASLQLDLSCNSPTQLSLMLHDPDTWGYIYRENILDCHEFQDIKNISNAELLSFSVQYDVPLKVCQELREILKAVEVVYEDPISF